MLKCLLPNWDIRYKCLGDVEKFLFSHHEFRLLDPSGTGALLVRERSGIMSTTTPTEMPTESPYFEIQLQDPPPIRIGLRIEDLFKFPPGDDERELAYQTSVEKVREDLRTLFNSSSSIKGSFRNYGSPDFERLEWLGDAVLNLELTIILLTFLSPFQLFDNSSTPERNFSSVSTSREAAGRNWTLALLFEELHISELINSSNGNGSKGKSKYDCLQVYYDFKMKGDIMEALLGELYSSLQDGNGTGGDEGHSDADQQELVIDVIQNIVSFSLYRSRFLLPQEEIEYRSRLANLPGGGGILSTTLIPEDEGEGEHDPGLDMSPEVTSDGSPEEAMAMDSSLLSLLSPEESLTYQTLLQKTYQKWSTYLTQNFRASRGTAPARITSKMKASLKKHAIFKSNSAPPPLDLFSKFLLDLFNLFKSHERFLIPSPSFEEDIFPLHVEVYQDPVWKSEAVTYWKRIIVDKFVTSLGTEMICGRTIRKYFKTNSDFHLNFPEVSQKEYLKTVYHGCQEEQGDGSFLFCGKACDEIWPSNRDIYSSIKTIAGYKSLLSQSWVTSHTSQWISKIVVNFRQTKGMKPFYLRTILKETKPSDLPNAVSLVDYFKIMEHSLRRETSSVCYEYRHYWKDGTNLPQGPCFWPIIYVQKKIQLKDEVHYLPVGLLKMREIDYHSEMICDVCETDLCIGKRIPLWSCTQESQQLSSSPNTNTKANAKAKAKEGEGGDSDVVDEDYTLCDDCFLIKLQSFIVESLQLLKKHSMNLFSFLNQSPVISLPSSTSLASHTATAPRSTASRSTVTVNKKVEISSCLQIITRRIHFNQLLYAYLGCGNQLLLRFIKLSIEKDAIEMAKCFLTSTLATAENVSTTAATNTNTSANASASIITYEGKSVVELRELEKIMKWMERYQYLGDMETFFLSNQQIFRVLEEKETGIKLIREISANVNANVLEAELSGDEETRAAEEQGAIGTASHGMMFLEDYESLFESYGHNNYFQLQSFQIYDLRTHQSYFKEISHEELEFRQRVMKVREELEIILREISLRQEEGVLVFKELIDSNSNESQLMEDLGNAVLHMEITNFLYAISSTRDSHPSLQYWNQILKSSSNAHTKKPTPSPLTSVSSLPTQLLPSPDAASPSSPLSPPEPNPIHINLSPGLLTTLRVGLESHFLLSFLTDELHLLQLCSAVNLFQDLFLTEDSLSLSPLPPPSRDFTSLSSRRLKSKIFRLLIGVIYHWRYVSPLLLEEAVSSVDESSRDGVSTSTTLREQDPNSYIASHGHAFIISLVDLLAYRSQFLSDKCFK
jgi:hypothetical protein